MSIKLTTQYCRHAWGPHWARSSASNLKYCRKLTAPTRHNEVTSYNLSLQSESLDLSHLSTVSYPIIPSSNFDLKNTQYGIPGMSICQQKANLVCYL